MNHEISRCTAVGCAFLLYKHLHTETNQAQYHKKLNSRFYGNIVTFIKALLTEALYLVIIAQ